MSKRRTPSTPHIPHATPYALQATPHTDTHTWTHSWSRVIMSSNSPFALSIKPLFYIHPKSTAVLRISKYRSETNHVMQGLLLLLCCFSAPRAPVCVDPPLSVIWSSQQHASDKPEGTLFSAGEVPDGELRTFPKKQRILPSPEYTTSN